MRNYELAMVLARAAYGALDPPDPAATLALAEVHAQLGQTERAVARTLEAVALAEAAGDPRWANEIRRQLKLYQEGSKDRAPP